MAEPPNVNERLWDKHVFGIVEENVRLRQEIRRLRTNVRYQYKRAESWKQRALRKRIRG